MPCRSSQIASIALCNSAVFTFADIGPSVGFSGLAARVVAREENAVNANAFFRPSHQLDTRR
jgi:hypothetical protein